MGRGVNTPTPEPTAATTNMHRLQSFVFRYGRLVDDKKNLLEDIKDVLKEAKLQGFDPKKIRQADKDRRLPPELRAELDAMSKMYLRAAEMRTDDDQGPDVP